MSVFSCTASPQSLVRSCAPCSAEQNNAKATQNQNIKQGFLYKVRRAFRPRRIPFFCVPGIPPAGKKPRAPHPHGEGQRPLCRPPTGKGNAPLCRPPSFTRNKNIKKYIEKNEFFIDKLKLPLYNRGEINILAKHSKECDAKL